MTKRSGIVSKFTIPVARLSSVIISASTESGLCGPPHTLISDLHEYTGRKEGTTPDKYAFRRSGVSASSFAFSYM